MGLAKMSALKNLEPTPCQLILKLSENLHYTTPPLGAEPKDAHMYLAYIIFEFSTKNFGQLGVIKQK